MLPESPLGNKLSIRRNFAHFEAQWRAANIYLVDAFASVEAEMATGEALLYNTGKICV